MEMESQSGKSIWKTRLLSRASCHFFSISFLPTEIPQENWKKTRWVSEFSRSTEQSDKCGAFLDFSPVQNLCPQGDFVPELR
jgi:hypothetical protein